MALDLSDIDMIPPSVITPLVQDTTFYTITIGYCTRREIAHSFPYGEGRGDIKRKHRYPSCHAEP
jgi:hypothetical protein